MNVRLLTFILFLGVAGVSLILGLLKSGQPGHVDGPGTIPPAQYSRIISMAPSVTEVLFALGLEERVVGVSKFCDYPPQARTKENIGGFMDPSYETILVLDPDLVILIADQAEVEERIRGLGLRALVVEQRRLESIIDSIGTIGTVCSVPDRAAALVRSIRDRIKKLTLDITPGTPPTVLACVNRAYDEGGIDRAFFAGGQTFYDGLISLAGGRNVCTNEMVNYPVFSAEGIMSLDPDVIIDLIPEMVMGSKNPGAIADDWNTIPGLRAVSSGRIHVITGDHVSVPGPRIIRLLEDIVAALYPPEAEYGHE